MILHRLTKTKGSEETHVFCIERSTATIRAMRRFPSLTMNRRICSMSAEDFCTLCAVYEVTPTHVKLDTSLIKRNIPRIHSRRAPSVVTHAFALLFYHLQIFIDHLFFLPLWPRKM